MKIEEINRDLPERSSPEYLSAVSRAPCVPSVRHGYGIDWERERSNTLIQHSYPLPEHGANGLLIQSVSCVVKSWAAMGWALQTAQDHYRLIGRPVTALIAPSESWTTADGYTPIPAFHLLWLIMIALPFLKEQWSKWPLTCPRSTRFISLSLRLYFYASKSLQKWKIKVHLLQRLKSKRF